MFFLQEYTEKEQASADPAGPPVRSINAYLQQPLERIQKYKAFLKVKNKSSINITELSSVQFC